MSWSTAEACERVQPSPVAKAPSPTLGLQAAELLWALNRLPIGGAKSVVHV